MSCFRGSTRIQNTEPHANSHTPARWQRHPQGALTPAGLPSSPSKASPLRQPRLPVKRKPLSFHSSKNFHSTNWRFHNMYIFISMDRAPALSIGGFYRNPGGTWTECSSKFIAFSKVSDNKCHTFWEDRAAIMKNKHHTQTRRRWQSGTWWDISQFQDLKDKLFLPVFK